MIGLLRGRRLWREGEQLILDVQGVGYEILATPAAHSAAEASAEVQLWIYTQLREDALQLYGFASLEEKRLFLELIKVNGVGPKSALHILAATSPEALIALIEAGDAKGLSQLPKVGKKTAEQIVLTLKGKLVSADVSAPAPTVAVRSEIVSALVHLGFRLADAEKAVAKMPADVSLEQGVREGLAALTS